MKKLNPAKVNQAFMALGAMAATIGEVFIDADATPRLAKYVLGASALLSGIGIKGWGMAIVDVFDGDTVPPGKPSMPPPEAFDAASNSVHSDKKTVPDQKPAKPRGPGMG